VPQTRTASIELREDGILVVRIGAKMRQSLTDADENLATLAALAGGVRRPLLVDISACEPIGVEVRHRYAGEDLVASFSAFGVLIAGSPFGRMMGNVYLRVVRSVIPTRLFTADAPALAWLREFVA